MAQSLSSIFSQQVFCFNEIPRADEKGRQAAKMSKVLSMQSGLSSQCSSSLSKLSTSGRSFSLGLVYTICEAQRPSLSAQTTRRQLIILKSGMC